jgi:hypothetical protein
VNLLVQTGIEGGGNYLAAAYVVFVAILLIYVVLMASKLARIERKIGDLAARLDDAGGAGEGKNAPVGAATANEQ